MLKFRLKELIAEKERAIGEKITYESLAKEVGVSRLTLARMAAPQGYVTSTKNIEKLCRYFGCTPDELIIFDPPLEAHRLTR